MMLKYVAIAVVAYLLGSLSFSVLISRGLFHQDVRQEGSGNAGATNMARVFGMRCGVLVFLADAAKTAAAALFGFWLGQEIGGAIACAACNIGHCYPVFFRFRGGKGVSVGAVIAFLIDWRIGLILLVVFFLMFAWRRIVSLCSVSVAVLLPLLCQLFALSAPRRFLGLWTGILIVFQHRSNIARLFSGKEAKFKPKK